MANTPAVVVEHEEFTRQQSERLGTKISELCSYFYAAEHRLLTLIREFDEQHGWEWLGFPTCAHWLNFKCGIDLNTARERVRVAHALGKLAKVDARFAAGALSYSKVRAITRIATESNEDYLLEMAMERQYGEIVSAETSEETELAPISARRADALAEVAETYMNSEPVPNSTADRYQVVVHVSAETSMEGPHIEDGPQVSAETSRRIACDCSLLSINEGDNGEPLSIGRRTRSIPPAMRRALRIRDKGCRFPGCTHDRYVDGHHIRHWADGGETCLTNLVSLCRHHHHLVHEGGFACEKNRDGEILFKDQQQEPLPDWSTLRTVDDQELDAWLDNELFEKGIDSDRCAAKWHAGEQMDWDLAVGHLFA